MLVIVNGTIFVEGKDVRSYPVSEVLLSHDSQRSLLDLKVCLIQGMKLLFLRVALIVSKIDSCQP